MAEWVDARDLKSRLDRKKLFRFSIL
jgi:hypothetical protein